MHQKIDRVVDATPLTVGGRMIQPKLRARGWEFSGTESLGEWHGALLQVTPVEVRVVEDEKERVVSITDPTQRPIRSMVASGLLVSGICLAIMFLARWRSRA